MNTASREFQAANRTTQTTPDLVSLAAPVFDVVLRIKSGIVIPSPETRSQTAALLAKFEERAERFRYPEKIVKLAKFALAAFIDETVLTNDFPLKEEWEKYPLQLEYFGEQLAGVKFFDRLDSMLRQIDAAIDVVEFYYVCLLLGFKGKYAVYQQTELGNVIRRTAEVLQKAGRIQNLELSPHVFVKDQPTPVEKPDFLPTWAKISLASGLGLSALIYTALLLFAHRNFTDAIDKLLF